MDYSARLNRLAQITAASPPVVSVYLDTHWGDEHQRDRVRLFLRDALARARDTAPGGAAAVDLDWVQSEGHALIDQAAAAQGVALFACQAIGLREVWPMRLPFADRFVVGPAPFLNPLAAALSQAPSALAVFVDAESARLIPIGPDGVGDELALQANVTGQHGAGGSAQLAQSLYGRHRQDHARGHFGAVAEALGAVVGEERIARIVMAGQPRNIALLRQGLPPRIDALVVGTVSGARDESAAIVARRAVELLGHQEGQRAAAEVDAVLTEAAKGQQAAAGPVDTLEAVNRGAVHRLYVHPEFRQTGHACPGCGMLGQGKPAPCLRCGGTTEPAELDAAMATRVIAAGGTVETVAVHADLARTGGVAAALRYRVKAAS